MLNTVREMLRMIGGRRRMCMYCHRPITGDQRPVYVTGGGVAHLSCVRYER